jgi:hypothetical protein
MRIWKGYIFIVGMLVLTGTVSAFIPNIITVTSSADSDSHLGWLVANGTDTTNLTIIVQNITVGGGPPTPVDMATVSFFYDTTYGSLTPPIVSTDSTGKATTIFKTNKVTNDNLQIFIDASTIEGNVSAIQTLKIDHDRAYFAYFDYQSEVTVDQTTPFIVTLKDPWGNRVDNKNPTKTHIVNLYYYPPPGGLGTGGFVGGGNSTLPNTTGQTDVDGNISLTVKVDTIPGENNIWMERIESVPDQYPYIIGVAQGEPAIIDQVFNPMGIPPFVPADGVSKFTIKYTLHDKFGNPAGNQSISVSTSIEGLLGNITTNSLGEAVITYGPKDTTSSSTVTAVAVANTTVTCSMTVEFRSTAPVNMLMVANPETMPSIDIKSDMVGEISAKVMDISGNPVGGQTVTFTLGTVSYNGTYTITAPPALLTTSATTDANGFATVQFRPGGFTANTSDPLYSQTATGSAIISASWTNVTQHVTVYWKNYPYLSVKTSVNPSTVGLNQTFDVTVELYGDGYKMLQNPIDVALVLDRSGSMGSDTPTRISSAQTAAKTFVDQMNPSRDRIAVVSYAGYTSGTQTRVDIPLTTDFSNVKTAINSLTAQGATETREAIKQAIEVINANPNPDPNAVQAIIVMTDGNYNWLGNPLGRGMGYPSPYNSFSTNNLEPNKYRYYNGLGGTLSGSPLQCNDGEFTNQNMSIYANNSHVRLYMISFASTLDPQAISDMRIMANATGGFYEHAPDAAKLNEIYTKIAGELRTSAGVNTTMDLDFENVSMNNITVPGNKVFDYVYLDGVSTHITNKTYDGTINQTADWNDDHKLSFDIGTVHLQETWKGTFRMRAINATGGNVNIFGPGSTISFNNNEATLTLPQTWVTIVPNLTNMGMNFTLLDVSNLHSTAPGVIKDYIPLEWQIAYDGNATVTEVISYSNDGGYHYVQFDTNYVTTGIFTDYSSLDVRMLPPGEYWIRVDATAPGAPDDHEIIAAPITVGTAGRAYIKLE